MKGLLFLSRVALFCNVLFLACLVLQRTPDLITAQSVKGTMIVLGWFLAPFINLSANIGYLIRVIGKKEINLPVWLAVTNLVFVVFQFFFHFILPS
ncbi:MAG: hypothetical protein JWQ30_1114 [Sediminibacterium sp.]|nr:hypothetical protein [Sediminibacterium sp.]